MQKFSVVAALSAGLVASSAYADQASSGPRGYEHMMWGGGYGMFGGLMMLVFWGAVIALAFVAARWFTDRRTGSGRSDAMDILKERFAKGEIDEDEFEKRKTALEN